MAAAHVNLKKLPQKILQTRKRFFPTAIEFGPRVGEKENFV